MMGEGDVGALARCHGKYQFRSLRTAVKVAKRLRRDKDATVAAYRCPDCRAWHVGGRGVFRSNRARKLRMADEC